MFKLLVLLFIIKLYARNNIFKRIKKKRGKDILSQVRSLENLKTRYMKVQTDIKFIKVCKQENLILTFANVKLSLRHNNNKLKETYYQNCNENRDSE